MAEKIGDRGMAIRYLGDSPKEVFNTITSDLQGFYSPLTSDRNIGRRFEPTNIEGNIQTNKKYYHKVYGGQDRSIDTLFANILIIHKSQDTSSAGDVPRNRQNYSVYFYVKDKDGKTDNPSKSESERESFLSYV